jgi:hypothetical protein
MPSPGTIGARLHFVYSRHKIAPMNTKHHSTTDRQVPFFGPKREQRETSRRSRDIGARRWRQLSTPVHPCSAPRSLGPVARSLLLPGAVVWVHVPFDDGMRWKTRPAVVLAVDHREVHLLPGYSSPSRWRFAWQYLELTGLEGTGLLRATGFRRRPITIDQIEIVSIAGRLRAHDWGRIRTLS